MLELTKPQKMSQWAFLLRLYREAFPAAERKPLWLLLRMYRKKRSDIWCVCCNAQPVGLAITINGTDTILIDYLAVDAKRRGQGIGTKILNALRQCYPEKGLFLEIENPFAPGPDQPLRRKRKEFYLRWGMKPMEVMVYLFGVEMELLGIDCCLTYSQYLRFYLENYSTWAVDHIRSSVYPKA